MLVWTGHFLADFPCAAYWHPDLALRLADLACCMSSCMVFSCVCSFDYIMWFVDSVVFTQIMYHLDWGIETQSAILYLGGSDGRRY